MLGACPKCGGQMAPRRDADVDFHECVGCRGAWFASGRLAAAMRTEVDLRATFPPRDGTGLVCPAGCRATLEVVQYSKTDEALLLDRCSDCSGLYLDAGELLRVVQLNERLRQLFGDGTFTGPPPQRRLSFLRRLFGRG